MLKAGNLLRKVSCIICGRVQNTGMCAECRSKSYGSSEYSRNSRIITTAARNAIAAGCPLPCIICKQPITVATQISVEHIIPVRQGGTSQLANLSAAHRKCNYGKAAYR